MISKLFEAIPVSTVPYIQDGEVDTLINNGTLVVVDFTATWCGPCRRVSPLMEQLTVDYSEQIKVVKIDIDQNKETAKKFAVKSIPAVLMFKSGELVSTIVGAKPYETFVEAVTPHL